MCFRAQECLNVASVKSKSSLLAFMIRFWLALCEVRCSNHCRCSLPGHNGSRAGKGAGHIIFVFLLYIYIYI
jgi:hypothetical protein